ncbi:Neisseria meningitidis TspB protein [compost metagenome]
MGAPYFKDGNWWRDRMDASPAPLPGQPTRVRIDIGPVKLEGMTDPNVKPDDTPASGSTAPKEQTKFCDDNPMSIACAEMGELEEDEITPEERPFQIAPKSPWGSDNASCPAPKVIQLGSGQSVSITYQPTCDFLSGVRPAVLALAFLAALYIALGIPVGQGD